MILYKWQPSNIIDGTLVAIKPPWVLAGFALQRCQGLRLLRIFVLDGRMLSFFCVDWEHRHSWLFQYLITAQYVVLSGFEMQVAQEEVLTAMSL